MGFFEKLAGFFKSDETTEPLTDENGNPVIRVRLSICGKVQGVNLRWEIREEALRLDLTGWVKNQDDNSVLAEAQGTREHINELKGFLTQNGRWTITSLSETIVLCHTKDKTFKVEY
mgnify:CR=1 FL=1